MKMVLEKWVIFIDNINLYHCGTISKNFIYISVLSTILLSGCVLKDDCIFDYEVEKDIIVFSQEFNLNNVNNDVILNIKSGDNKFICLSGMGMSMPINASVLSEKFISLEDKLFKSYGYKCICVSDIITSKGYSKGAEIIFEYIVKYNSLLYHALNKQPIKK